MQAPATQRTIQRRSPAGDPGPPPSIPARSMSPGPVSQNRASSSSTKSSQNGGSRRQTTGATQNDKNQTPLSTIEKSVTHLLVATKQLLETLTQWSRHQATDAQVSDVYVRLGYEFNIACRAFSNINVDTSDLGNVPELLRHILESTLSQEASVESLERYLPRIRDIIINLLHGLKRKQQKLRQKQARDAANQNGDPSALPRTSSVSSVGTSSTGLTAMLDNIPEASPRESVVSNDVGIPPRISSVSAARRANIPRDQSRSSVSSDQSTLSSGTMQNMPVLPPYPGDETIAPSMPDSGEPSVDAFPPPPPPPPKQTNAFAALQRGGDLERRASRRYSAYQISKHLNTPAYGVPMIPAPQNSPIPNRGRNDARESMRAVQNRGERQHMRQQSSRINTEVSPAPAPRRVSEEDGQIPAMEPPSELPANDSPTAKTPEDMLRKPANFDAPSATLKGPPVDDFPVPDVEISELPSDENGKEFPKTPEQKHSETVSAQQSSPQSTDERQFTPDLSPPPGSELTLFLQYKTKVKKFLLPGGYNGLSMARLQLAFIEKFAWNTHNNGVDLPEIYIQDPVSGVRHELEDLSDIKHRSVLVLNVEVLDEVKRHIDEGLSNIKKMVEGVRTVVDDQQATILRVSDRQQDTAKEMAKLAAAPASRISYVEGRSAVPLISPSKVDSFAQLSEIQGLRRDLAVVRQTFSGFEADVQTQMATIRAKAGSVKALAVKAALPDLKGDSGRAYVNTGKKSLSQDSDKLVSQVDDLQDMVEDLRKDVVLRGVRPLPRQLETVAKDISQATMELKKMQDFLKRERPIWTKIWEKELETVCNDREEMTMQEELATDLQDDLEKASQTFALVEQATKEQMRDTPGSTSNAARALSRGLNHVVAADPTAAKEGVLDEVRALQPNHENRLEAIERAEKLRQKELESRRGGEFQKELGSFVEEGKLKKSGGFEEVERARRAKDERIRREVWERQNGMTQADALADAVSEEIGPESGEDKEEDAPSADV